MKVRSKRDHGYKAKYGSYHMSIEQIRHARYCRHRWFSIINNWLKSPKNSAISQMSGVKWHFKRRQKRRKSYAVSIPLCGLYSSLSLYVDDRYQCMMMVKEQNQFWDALWVGDILPMQLTSGQWFDGFVSDHQTATTFTTLSALVETEMLQPLTNWITSELLINHWLCLYGEPDGTTWAKLEADSEYLNRFYLQQSEGLSLSHDAPKRLYHLYPIQEIDHVSTRY